MTFSNFLKDSVFSRASTLLCAGIAGLFLATAVMPEPAWAQRANKDDSAPVEEGRQFDSKTGQIVNDALTLINEDNWSGALAKLNEAIALPDLNPYERSTIQQMRGQSLYELDRVGDAIQAFEGAINAGGLLPNESEQLRGMIAQLLIAEGEYIRGAQMLENWINSGNNPKPNHIELLVNAYVSAEDYRSALPWAERWFRDANPKERRHFDLLNYLYNTLEMPGKQADIVKQMLNRWPDDRNLWEAWASMLSNGGREAEAFEVNKIMYLAGMFQTENDILKIVNYYSFYEMPYQAAQIMQREMNAGKVTRTPDNLETLSNLLRQAREYQEAIPVLREAAEKKGTAKLFADLGEALYNEGECGEAESAFRTAIQKGYDAGKAWMLIGTCRYEVAFEAESAECDQCYEDARARVMNAPRTQARNNAIEAFEQAANSGRTARDARKWIGFIQNETKAEIDRCEYQCQALQERCFVEIENEYEMSIFNGEVDANGDPILKISDDCQSYLAEYQALYVKKGNDN